MGRPPYTLYRAGDRGRRGRRMSTVAVAALLAGALLAVVAVGAWFVSSRSGAHLKAGAGGVGPPGLARLTPTAAPSPFATLPVGKSGDGIKIGTFLGNASRRFYGLGPAPKKLDLIWRTSIGSGLTESFKRKPWTWSGTGWTGQPSLVRDGGKLYIIIGGYDHGLHKIDAQTGKIVWTYYFDDVIKSSASVFRNPSPSGADDRYIVLAGSRQGYPLPFTDPGIAPYRAVTFGTGKELWRLPVPLTASYSRDCDGSGFFLGGREYIGVESGWFYSLDPLHTQPWVGHREPLIKASRLLLGGAPASHGGELTLESSPALLGDTIYIDSGDGHVYGLRRGDLKVVFDYDVGSDMEGTTVPTTRGKLLVPVEKQFIPGHGGVLMLDPSKPAAQSVVWFFPTDDRHFAEWDGGVIGSVAVNDTYNVNGDEPRLAAFIGVGGYLYVVSQDTLASGKVPGPNLTPLMPTPRLVFKTWIGGAISTPILVGNTLIAGGYDDTVHMYHLRFTPSAKGIPGALPCPDGTWRSVSVREVSRFTGGGSYESTPILWDGRVYIGSRDGWFYCLGDR